MSLEDNTMKYQAIQHLKTKNKLIKLCDTLQEAHDTLKEKQAVFDHFSYYGGFPIYHGDKNKIYSVQGQHDTLGIVLSLNKEELKDFNFNI